MNLRLFLSTSVACTAILMLYRKWCEFSLRLFVKQEHSVLAGTLVYFQATVVQIRGCETPSPQVEESNLKQLN